MAYLQGFEERIDEKSCIINGISMNKTNVKNHNLIKENRGSTLITVIVAIAFVTILTTVILGTSLVNLKMKGIDRATRDDFYYAEKALDDIYAGLGQEMSIIAGDEYEKAFEKVGTEKNEYDAAGNLISSIDYGLSEEVDKEFRREFIKKVYGEIGGISNLKDKLQAYVTAKDADGNPKGKVEKVGSVTYEKKDGTTATGYSDASRVKIKDVTVSVTDSNGYQSVISTDIVIETPTVDFLGANADVTEYGLIANQGLYIKGRASITGNVYAGVHDAKLTADDDFVEENDDKSRGNIYGGINIENGEAVFKGNYIVSKGDINISGAKNTSGVNTVFTVGNVSSGGDANLPNLWFTSLRTVTPMGATTDTSEKIINVNANVYALNDLKLNADKSSVTISGNYYGYNDKTLTKPSSSDALIDVLGLMSGRDDAQSSAIIINGSEATLDMRDINNFVLMGKAYVDFESDGGTPQSDKVVATAEGVALKTNQQLYLVPSDFLEGPNPATDAEYGSGFSIKSELSGSLKEGGWFGFRYLDATTYYDFFTDYSVDKGGTKVHYAYLKFNDKTWKLDGSSSEYVEDTSGAALGTNGSISSKAAFFYDIMTAKSNYEKAYANNPEGASDIDEYIENKEKAKIQPSAYRLYERIYGSMGYEYFNLKECVIGDSENVDKAHYYAKNAVINYEKDSSSGDIQSNVLANTHGMYRYAAYPQNLFRRYVWLCTRLDGREDYTMETDPGDPGSGDWTVSYASTDAPPLSHFIMIDKISGKDTSLKIADAEGEGLKNGAYGYCIVKDGDLEIKNSASMPLLSGTTFKGIAVVDGNITVAAGIDVDGLLMATGTITLEGDNDINYNKGLIQSRIEKEMNIVKNSTGSTADAYKDYYIISYLSKDSGSTRKLIYDVEAGSKIKEDRIEADYNEFMHYENWQKGEK